MIGFQGWRNVVIQQLHKDNHYVPKLYLKQWADQGFIPTYRLLVPSENVPLWKKQSLKGIAFHQHLYTYLVGQEETDEFERWLDREFESPAEEAIRRVVQEERMEAEHWRRLVRFAVALNVRTPARLKQFIGRQNEKLLALMDETLQSSVQKLEAAVSCNEPIPQQVEEDDALSIFKNIYRRAIRWNYAGKGKNHRWAAAMGLADEAPAYKNIRSFAGAQVDDIACTGRHVLAYLRQSANLP